MNTALALLFASVTQSLSLPPGLLRAVCYTESGYDTLALHVDDGGADSLGVCQERLSTARMLGYKGDWLELIGEPEDNVMFAGKYLKHLLVRYHGDIPKAVSAYNAGTYTRHNKAYVKKVLRAWAERK